MHRVAQGTREWREARCGVATASMFKVAREWVGGLDERQQRYVDLMKAGKPKALCIEEAGYKNAPTSETVQRALDGEVVGGPSPAAQDYAFRLACERISGELLDEGHTTWQMERGQELEPAARRAHEIEAGVIVSQVGFLTSLDGKFGCSADGFINDCAGAEYKCLVSPAGIKRLWIDNDLSEFIDQVQGGLWLTGFQTWHFAMYCPALKTINRELYLRIAQRDDDYIEALQRDMWRFESMVTQYEKTLRGE
jgi:hypothetical protein